MTAKKEKPADETKEELTEEELEQAAGGKMTMRGNVDVYPVDSTPGLTIEVNPI